MSSVGDNNPWIIIMYGLMLLNKSRSVFPFQARRAIRPKSRRKAKPSDHHGHLYCAMCFSSQASLASWPPATYANGESENNEHKILQMCASWGLHFFLWSTQILYQEVLFIEHLFLRYYTKHVFSLIFMALLKWINLFGELNWGLEVNRYINIHTGRKRGAAVHLSVMNDRVNSSP